MFSLFVAWQPFSKQLILPLTCPTASHNYLLYVTANPIIACLLAASFRHWILLPASRPTHNLESKPELAPLYSLGADPTDNTDYSSSPTVACITVARLTWCLMCRNPVTDVPFDSSVPAFSGHAKIFSEP